MPALEPHIVLVAHLAGEPNAGNGSADAVLRRLHCHHDLLNACVDEAFGTDREPLGTCDDNAILLCEAEHLPLAVDAARRFVGRLREQDEHPGLVSRLGLADGVERWTPGTRWQPEMFGSAVTAAQQLAAMARGEQIVCLDRLREHVDLASLGCGLRWSAPLQTTLGAGPCDVAAIVSSDADGLVWNLQELQADLRRAAKQTSVALQIVAEVDAKLERIPRDNSNLAEILSKLKSQINEELPLEVSASPFVRLRAMVRDRPQLERLETLDRAVSQMWDGVKELHSLFDAYRSDFVAGPDDQRFRNAHVDCKEIIGKLREHSERANDHVLRWIDEAALRAAIERSTPRGMQPDAV